MRCLLDESSQPTYNRESIKGPFAYMTTSQFIIEKLLHVSMDYPSLLWPIGNIPNWVFFLYSPAHWPILSIISRRE
jgi:hypothetical protein